MKNKFLVFIIALGSSSLFLNGQSTIPEKVLFVGNSYTYFWNLPQNVGLMAAASEIKMKTSQSTAGGSHWGHHWRGERNLTTLDLLNNGDYDAVVIQNHSRSALDMPDSLMFFGKKLADLIKMKGAKIYLYQTWAREWDPYMQAIITEKYLDLAKIINAQVVPVGQAWERARELRPEMVLYDEDGSHPSSLGTYLTACVFYGILTQKSPVGLPHRLSTLDKDGEKLFINIQSQESALFCQKVAEEIINKYVD